MLNLIQYSRVQDSDIERYYQFMKLAQSIAIATTTMMSSYLIVSCGGQAKMEQCKLVEIELGKLEVEFGDLELEGGKVEMVCGDRIVDVPWNQFRRYLGINPEEYINNLEAFNQEVYCLINESSQEKIVYCSRPDVNNKLVGLNFNYDD
ncbi:MAG: hypothetical protein AAGF83_15030 [Cyanobacteria bacterium P01_G01_bin.67]